MLPRRAALGRSRSSAVADQGRAGAVDEVGQRRVVAQRTRGPRPGPPSRGATTRSSSVSTAGCRYTSVTPGRRSNSAALDRVAATADRCEYTKWSGNTTPSAAASSRNGKPTEPLAAGAGHAQRQAEVDRELEVDVEELGPQLQRAHVAVEVADVEAPEDRPLDLRAALAAHLVEVGVVPGVLDRAGEAAVAVEQARRVGDRTPAVGLPLGVEREVHADVLAAVLRGGVARPRARHHQRRARARRRCAARRTPRRWPTATSRGRRS